MKMILILIRDQDLFETFFGVLMHINETFSYL